MFSQIVFEKLQRLWIWGNHVANCFYLCRKTTTEKVSFYTKSKRLSHSHLSKTPRPKQDIFKYPCHKIALQEFEDHLCSPPRSLKKWKSLSRVQLFATPWTVACQVPLPLEFSRQEYWSGSPFFSPGDLPDPGIKLRPPSLQADSSPSKPPGNPLSQFKTYKIVPGDGYRPLAMLFTTIFPFTRVLKQHSSFQDCLILRN